MSIGPTNSARTFAASIRGNARLAASLMAFAVASVLPFALLIAARGFAAAYDTRLLPLLYRGLLPVLPVLFVGAAALAVFRIESGYLRQILSAVLLGLLLGFAVAYDRWYFAPVTLALFVPFVVWRMRWNAWSYCRWNVALGLGVLVAVLVGVVLDWDRAWPVWDNRFSPGLPYWLNVLSLLVVLAAIGTFGSLWALRTLAFGDARNRGLLADLIRRDPRCGIYFDAVAKLTRSRLGLRKGARLPGCAVNPEKIKEPLFPDAVRVPAKVGQAWWLGYWALACVGPAVLVRWLRTPVDGVKLPSDLLLEMLDEAAGCEYQAYESELLPEASLWADLVQQRVAVSRQPRIIGRDARANIDLADESVSSQHCKIWLGDDGIHVRDLESANGTLVNDVAVGEAVLRHGDRLQIGRFAFVAELHPPSETINGLVLAEALLGRSAADHESAVLASNERFARYVVLKEAAIEARRYFFLAAPAPPDAAEIPRLLAQVHNGGPAYSGEPAKTDSYAEYWQAAATDYQRLWQENVDRLILQHGVAALQPTTETNTVVDFHQLTLNLLACRWQAHGPTATIEQAAADLALWLFVSEEPGQIPRVLRSYFARVAAAGETDPPELALAVAACALWQGRRADWVEAGRPFVHVNVATDMALRNFAHVKAGRALQVPANQREDFGVEQLVRDALVSYRRLNGGDGAQCPGSLLAAFFIFHFCRT